MKMNLWSLLGELTTLRDLADGALDTLTVVESATTDAERRKAMASIQHRLKLIHARYLDAVYDASQYWNKYCEKDFSSDGT